jgi:hypothetical protein
MIKKQNTLIRQCHIQKTQPPRTAKKMIGRERERESMVYKMTISKQTPQTINKK